MAITLAKLREPSGDEFLGKQLGQLFYTAFRVTTCLDR